MSYKIVVVGFNGLINPFEELSKGLTFRQINRFEKTTADMFADTQARVHVLTSKLKLSGQPRTHFDGDEWSGEIEYAENPGIFEIARGDSPSRDHPEGGHDFFGNLDSFLPVIEGHINSVFQDAFDKQAPI